MHLEGITIVELYDIVKNLEFFILVNHGDRKGNDE